MPVIALKAKDKATGQLSAGISAASLSIVLKSGEGSAFPQPYTGTCSSTGSSTTLNDTGDLANLAVGDFVRNVTDGSWAFVTVAGTNSVTTTQLRGGTDNSWESGDTWRVNEFVVTIAGISSGVDTAYEEVLISNRSTDTLTVPSGGRGYNSTTAQSFVTDDYVQLRVTAPYHEEIKMLLKEFKQQVDTNTTDIDSIESNATFYVAAGGSSSAFTGTLSSLPSTYTTGERFTFKANHTITGSATFNRASLGAKTLKKRLSTGLSDLASGDIQSGDLVEIEYDGTYYQVLSHYGAAFVTLSSIGFFGDGSDGSVTWSASTNLDPATEKRYTSATLDAGQTLSVSSVNTPLVIHNTGNVTINGTVDLNGKGGAAGAAGTGTNGAGATGTAGNSLVSGWTNGAGTGGTSSAGAADGGGGGSSFDNDGSAGEEPGDAGTPGSGGTRIDPEKVAFLANLKRGVVCGGGGGGGSRGTAGTAGAGGAGGGALVWMIGGNLTLGASSIIRANGAAGSAGTGTAPASGEQVGGGGGGGGGSVIILVAGTITNSGVTVSATGGALGDGERNGSDFGSGGGAGGNGKVIIYSLSTGTLITA